MEAVAFKDKEAALADIHALEGNWGMPNFTDM